MILTEYVIYRGKMIKVNELKNNSHVKVEVECPECKEKRTTPYKNITKNGHCVCHSCVLKIKNTKNTNIGDKYGKWTVIENGNKTGFSLCQCDCGNIREVENYTLRNGLSKSCGCIMASINKKNRKYLTINSKYNRLTVIGHSDNSGYSIC